MVVTEYWHNLFGFHSVRKRKYYTRLHCICYCSFRVATAQGKLGIWFLLFPDRENTGNFVVTQGKFLRHKENIFDYLLTQKACFSLHIFKIFSLAISHFKTLLYELFLPIYLLYQYIYCTMSHSYKYQPNLFRQF